LNEAVRLQCDLIIIHVGSNDLCSPHHNPHTLADDLRRLAAFAACSSPTVRVVVDQIFQRQTVPDADYNRRVRISNSAIREVLRGEDRCTSAFHRSLCSPSPSLFSDGVHFTPAGCRKFLRGIRGIILRSRALD
jgi:lysophospholipase L1-like esterase